MSRMGWAAESDSQLGHSVRAPQVATAWPYASAAVMRWRSRRPLMKATGIATAMIRIGQANRRRQGLRLVDARD